MYLFYLYNIYFPKSELFIGLFFAKKTFFSFYNTLVPSRNNFFYPTFIFFFLPLCLASGNYDIVKQGVPSIK